jgi:hypothetical protein
MSAFAPKADIRGAFVITAIAPYPFAHASWADLWAFDGSRSQSTT